MTQPADAIAAIVAGLATVAGLTETGAVTDRVGYSANCTNSAWVYASGNGYQEPYVLDETRFRQVHHINIRLALKNTGNVQRLYDDLPELIANVLAWFRTNNTLSGTVISCHASRITYTTPEALTQLDNGTIYRETTITVPVQVDDLT
jgi:hypothetical protein